MPGKLTQYQRKRDFRRTPEPAGKAAGDRAAPADRGERRFVVQRHRARRLHYDLRFEIDGVLVSWAVPRGPTLDPDVKRTAVHVEDHPVEYLDFEGVIPQGEYGAGDVIVWDRGTWELHATGHPVKGHPTKGRPAPGPDDPAEGDPAPGNPNLGDPAAAVAAGELHVDVHGEKLRGRLILIRRERAGASGSGSEQWLLVHKHDEYAVPGWDPEDHPASVLSGRTNDEVKADPERMWRSDLPAASASVRLRPADPPLPHVTGPGPGELAALDALGSGGTWEVFGRSLRLTNLDKDLFPGRPGEPAVTKRELIRYSAQIAPVVLPYLAGRPLNMHRFPGGAQAAGFWHKQLPDHAPDWLPRWHDPAAEAGQDLHLPGRRRAGRAGLGGQLRRAGMACLDRAGRSAGPPQLRAR